MKRQHRSEWSESAYARDAEEREAVARTLADLGLDLGTVAHLTDHDGSATGETLTPWWEQ
jgi:hypothetical protein